MAITATNLTTAGSATDANSYTTASVSTSANALVTVALWSVSNVGTDPIHSTPAGTLTGFTWTVVQTVLFTSSARLTVWRGMKATAGSGTVVLAATSQQARACWSVTQFTGVDTSGTDGSGAVLQSLDTADGASATNAVTITLAAFANSNNMAYGVFATLSGGAFTVGSGFTQLGVAQSGAENARILSEQKLNDNTVDASCVSATRFPGVALEIKGTVTTQSTGAALTGTGAISAAGARFRTGAAAFTSTGAVSATGRRIRLGQAALAAAGTVVPVGLRITRTQAALSGTGAVTPTGRRVRFGATALTGSGTVAATGAHTTYGTTALTGSGAVSTAGAHIAFGDGALVGTGAVSAAGRRTASGIATIHSTGSVTVAAGVIYPNNGGTIEANGHVSGGGVHVAVGQAAISTGVPYNSAHPFDDPTIIYDVLTGGQIFPTGVVVKLSSAALTGSGGVAAAGGRLIVGQAVIAAPGMVSAAGQRFTSNTVVVTAAGTVAATGRRVVPAAGVITGAGTVAPSSQRIILGQASILSGFRYDSPQEYSDPTIIYDEPPGTVFSATGIGIKTRGGAITGTGVLVPASFTAAHDGQLAFTGTGSLTIHGKRVSHVGRLAIGDSVAQGVSLSDESVGIAISDQSADLVLTEAP